MEIKVLKAFKLKAISFCISCMICQSFLSFHAASQTNKIAGNFPGKQNSTLYINYFPPKIAAKNEINADSCIIDNNGKFEFIVPFAESVLATIRFDYSEEFDFVTDKRIVTIRSMFQGREFDFSEMEAISPVNKSYTAYKEYINTEYKIADSLYAIRERFRDEKKRDSMKLLEPSLEYADSILHQKSLDFVKSSSISPIINALVIYRKLMLRVPMEVLKQLFTNLGSNGQQSVYGSAIAKYIQDKEGLHIGDVAPLLNNQLSPEGIPMRIENFKGKYLLIDFWAGWCAPCRAENPNTIRIYNKYSSDRFEILGVSLDRRKEDWLKAIKQDNLPWKQASDLQFWDSECVKLYGLYAIPFNVLIGPEGKIVSIDLHGEELENKIKESINKKLGSN